MPRPSARSRRRWISWPCSSPARPRTESGQPLDEKILVVDDEIISRRVIGHSLEKAGLKSVAVSHPDEALKLLEEQPFDLVFLDVEMPGMNGFELCKRLRAMPLHAKTPVIFVTALGGFESRAKSSLSGGDDFIGKPFSYIELAVKGLIYVLRGSIGAGRPAGSGQDGSRRGGGSRSRWRFPPIHDRSAPAAYRIGASRRVAFAVHPRHAAGGTVRPYHAAGHGVVRRADFLRQPGGRGPRLVQVQAGHWKSTRCPGSWPFARTPSSIPTRRSWSTTPRATNVFTTTRW